MKQIPLLQGKFAIVDDEDYPYLSRFRFILTGGEVFATLLREKMRYVQIPMWCFIISAPNAGGQYVSFKNQNRLDFRKENLYYVQDSEKQHRGHKRLTHFGKKPSSIYKGVALHQNGKWTSAITKDKKCYWLGRFKTEKEAAIAYNQKSKELYGEHAYQNIL